MSQLPAPALCTRQDVIAAKFGKLARMPSRKRVHLALGEANFTRAKIPCICFVPVQVTEHCISQQACKHHKRKLDVAWLLLTAASSLKRAYCSWPTRGPQAELEVSSTCRFYFDTVLQPVLPSLLHCL